MAAIWAGLLLLAGVSTLTGEDDLGGLPPGPGQAEVFYTCDACHSIKLVKQQGLPRDTWDKTLDWMIEEHGMGELDTEERSLILDYLEKHFGVPGSD